jgi:hypothetical protein
MSRVVTSIATCLLILYSTIIGLPLKARSPEISAQDEKPLQVSPETQVADWLRLMSQREATLGWENSSRLFMMIKFNRKIYPALGITTDQDARIREFEGLVNSARKASLRRDVEALKALKAEEISSKSFMKRVETQLDINEKRRDAAAKAAEGFLKTGILSDNQADLLKKFCWWTTSPESLIKDDELARWLRLDRDQRNLIAQRLAERQSALNDFQSRAVTISKLSDAAERADRQGRELNKLATDRVWDVLTPEQLDQWDRMIRSLPDPSLKKH